MRMRHKLERWRLGCVPRITTNRCFEALHTLQQQCPPRIAAAVLRTMWNGWCTARRFQGTGTCLLGCCYDNTDSIEHYSRCPQVSTLRGKLGLPASKFQSLPGFLNCISGITDEELQLNSLVVYATYSSVNTIRHTGRLCTAQVQHMLMEYCKLAAAGHTKSLRTLHTALLGGRFGRNAEIAGLDEPAQPARRRRVS